MNGFIESGFDIMDIANILEVMPNQGANTHVNRKYHGLVYYYSANHLYKFQSDHALNVSAGNVLYLPKDSSYTISALGIEDSHCIAINFYTHSPSDYPPFVYAHQSLFFQEMFERALRARLRLRRGHQAQAMSCLYGIIAQLQYGMDNLRPSTALRQRIKPGIEQLESSFMNPDLRISDLAQLCGISEAHFRNIFKSIYGMSPLNYLHSLRLNLVNELITSGEYTVVSATERAGFTDPSAFYRLYKKVYGMSPMQWRKLASPDSK